MEYYDFMEVHSRICGILVALATFHYYPPPFIIDPVHTSRTHGQWFDQWICAIFGPVYGMCITLSVA